MLHARNMKISTISLMLVNIVAIIITVANADGKATCSLNEPFDDCVNYNPALALVEQFKLIVTPPGSPPVQLDVEDTVKRTIHEINVNRMLAEYIKGNQDDKYFFQLGKVHVDVAEADGADVNGPPLNTLFTLFYCGYTVYWLETFRPSCGFKKQRCHLRKGIKGILKSMISGTNERLVELGMEEIAFTYGEFAALGSVEECYEFIIPL